MRLRIQGVSYCYQRLSKSGTYQLMNQKLVNSSASCASSADRDQGFIGTTWVHAEDSDLELFSEDSKLNGWTWSLKLPAIQED